MGSGKSNSLIIKAFNFRERKIPHLILKPFTDFREQANVIRSRIGIETKCEWIYEQTDVYGYLKERFEQLGFVPEWILVDEAQFLTPTQVDGLAHIVDELGSNVMCYGLRTDFQSHLFPGSKRLFELADTIEELKSTCGCGRKTIINARFAPDGVHFMSEGEQIGIGGDEVYTSVCRSCWHKLLI